MFRGTGIAIITPFQDGKIDWAAFERLIEGQIQAGTDCIVALGTTGEPSTQSVEEKSEVTRFVIDQVAGRIPVMVGAGANSTAAAIEASKRMVDLGAESLLHVTPYYNKATQGGLVAHYTAIADSVDVPVVTYNVPGRTSTNMLPETVAVLADHPNIAGHKEACGNIAQIMELFRLCRGKLRIWSGNDDHVFPMLALGGDGVISVAAHVIARDMAELTHKYFEGDTQGSLAIQERANPLIAQLFTEVSPIPVKAALSMMGICEEELRLPLVPMTDEGRASLRKEMEAYGLLRQ
jgi:dihydrodipicolinate synthase